jgi:hypothetical protein
MKRSKPALENSGSKTVVPQAATWSSGLKPSLESRRENGKYKAISLTHDVCLERPDLSIQLP